MNAKLIALSAIFLLSSILTQAFGQSLLVSGKVKDKITGTILSDATVSLKDGSVRTKTDAQGNFTIKVPQKGSVLVISFVGMTTVEYTVNDNSPLNIIMEVGAAPTLDEVVVNVGYGTQKKSVVTGSISSVKARELEKVPNGRIEQALQGRVAGVTIASNSGQPGSTSTIRVRGVSTLGSSNPLWVVDGVVVDAGAMGFLNQSDIESIEVLKDAASSAIYGTRAAAGVILVTTKKGKAGQMIVSYNGFYGSSAPAKVLKLLNATQYAALLNEKSVAGGGNVIFPDLSTLGTGTDWQKEIFNNNAHRYSHEVSLSGGNDKSTFYLSFGTQNQEGIVATDISNYSKQSIRLNSTHKIGKIFTFGQTLGYTHQKGVGIGNTNSEFGGPLSSAINLDPITSLIVTDPVAANAAPYSVNPVIRDPNGNPYGISSIVGQEMTNPIAYIQTRLGNYNKSDDMIGSAFLEAVITKHIKIKSTIGGKLAFWGDQNFTPVYYLSATNSVLKNSFSKSNNNTLNWSLENTVSYSNKFKEHNVNVLLGQGAYVENNGGYSAVTIQDLPITSYKDASFNFDIPQANRTSGTSDFTLHKISSLFARVNYDYQEKYLLTGIIRRDGSTRFGLNNKYANFPSMSLGWMVSKEDFWKSSNTINNLKIRGGYGTVGTDDIRDFGYLSTVVGGFNYTLGNAGNITTGYAPSSLDNPDLKWEQTSQLNIGFEAQLFHDFNMTFDWYKKSTTGLLRGVQIPGYVGVTTRPVANVANMDNTGLEFELGYRKKFGKLNFSANANFSTLSNNVTYVDAFTNFITGDASFQSMGAVTRTQVGQPINSFYGFKTAGIFQNMAEINAYKNTAGNLVQPNARPGDFRWTDTDADGTITDNDKIFLGNSLPKYSFGFSVNLEYKGFDFMVFAQGNAGSKIFQGLRRLDIGNSNYQTKALGRWTGDGTSTDFPRLTSNDANGNFGKMSDFYLESGDYLRLKLVQVGYTLPTNILNKIKASRLRFYVTAENLLTLTKYTGYDPEIGGGVFGIDKGIYPQARSFILGVQLQF
ncbi:MAG: TonB-dependent receptor [Chitinophagaceae bacterium]|nr:TonB-dependent receptor [Chitinophagaceae bacterium]